MGVVGHLLGALGQICLNFYLDSSLDPCEHRRRKTMADVFISYFTENRERADALGAAIEKHGFTTFVDHKILKLGDELAKELDGQIQRAACVVFLWSEHASAKRPWVLREFKVAKKDRARTIVVRLDEPLPPTENDTLFPDMRGKWQVPKEPPAPLVKEIVEAVQRRVILAPGFTKPLHALRKRLESARYWPACDIQDLDFDRTAERAQELAADKPSTRLIIFVELPPDDDEREQRVKQINKIRLQPGLRCKPIFVLIEGAKPPPQKIRHYFPIPANAENRQLDTLWEKIAKEWDQSPKPNK